MQIIFVLLKVVLDKTKIISVRLKFNSFLEQFFLVERKVYWGNGNFKIVSGIELTSVKIFGCYCVF
jgi:hypothetical protein